MLGYTRYMKDRGISGGLLPFHPHLEMLEIQGDVGGGNPQYYFFKAVL